jgi:hypothetical protein
VDFGDFFEVDSVETIGYSLDLFERWHLFSAHDPPPVSSSQNDGSGGVKGRAGWRC